jgi:hypothetical protein
MGRRRAPDPVPSFEGQFGEKGNFFFGVRQSRIGIKPHVPTALGEVTAQFDIDMFGTGVDAGQTTIRLRHAYASSASSASARPKARSWTSMYSRTSWTTGARTAWSSSGTCNSAGPRSMATTS